jgi:hypothetical protein
MPGMHTPIILIELVLVFGGVLLFGWWQLRSIDRDRRQAAEAREREQRQERDREHADEARP